MSTTDAPAALTIGEIVRQTGSQLHRVQYVIRSRGILPTSRAGNLRIFSEADLQYIASELRRIAEERGEQL